MLLLNSDENISKKSFEMYEKVYVRLLRLSELIENSVGLPAATSKGNTPTQYTHLSATLPRCARELIVDLVFCS